MTAMILLSKSSLGMCSIEEHLSERADTLCCLSILVGLFGIGPSDLSECALVRFCSGGTKIGFVDMDCNVLGPEKVVSGEKKLV